MRRKLNAMPVVFEGRSVLLVDDSIVRGTTMSQIVDMVRRAGAKKVTCHTHAIVSPLPLCKPLFLWLSCHEPLCKFHGLYWVHHLP